MRVFEVRYTDMVRDCLRTGTPFGVVNITRGSDTQASSDPEHCLTGTLATIVDFDMHEPAVLMIAAQGGQRFTVQSTHAQASGLIRADVTLIEGDMPSTIPETQQKCATLLEQIIKELEQQHTQAEKDGQKPFGFPVAKPYQLDDAGWVANRFSELMPIARTSKQMLLEQSNPNERLNWIHDFLKEKDVI